jgi:hypothetical protein
VFQKDHKAQENYKQNNCPVKKFIVFPSSAGMSLTKLSLAGDNLKIPVQGEFG